MNMISNLEGALQKQGWNVTPERVEGFLNEEENSVQNNNNVDDVMKALLDLDLNSVGSQGKGDSNKQKAETVTGPLMLQIQKVRNVSAPKANETSHTAPQLFRVTVTDGNSTYQILQIGKWNSVSLETPPGTKMQLKAGNTCKVVCGFLPLKQNQFTLFGGTVPGLVEKWQMTKVYGLNNRQRDNHAPKWVPFGHQISNLNLKDNTGNFKSLEQEAKQAKENEAFDQQRLANIEEISKSFDVKKKSFVKSKPPVTEVLGDVKQPPYQRRQEQPSLSTANRPGRNDSAPERGRHERRMNPRGDEREEGSAPSAPSKPTTLFDFLTNKLGDGEGAKDVPSSFTMRDPVQSGDSGSYRDNRRGGGRGGYGGNRYGDYDRNPHSSYKFGEDHSWPNFQNGDKVLAKYWEDHKMHRAVITALGEAGRTCVIRFVDYDNYEEVLLSDVQPCPLQKWENYRPGGGPQRPARQQQQQQYQQPGRDGRGGGGGLGGGRRGGIGGGGGPPHPRAFDEGGNLNHNFSGTFEFRRGGAKPYVQGRGGGGAPPSSSSSDAPSDRGGKPPQHGRPDRQFYQPPRRRRE